MPMQFAGLTRNAEGRRVNLWAAYEPSGAYLGTYTLDDLMSLAQAQGFWIDRVRYRLAGERLDGEALAWRPNGLPDGDMLWDFMSFCVSPTREIGDSGEIEVCEPNERQMWSIYGCRCDLGEWQIVHDATWSDAGDCLARITDLTGALIEYRDAGRAYANTRLADLAELLAQRIEDETTAPGTDPTLHPLHELHAQIVAALQLREV